MNANSRAEAWARQWLIANGWEVLHRGWPDFLVTRGLDVRALEIKGPGDSVSAEQTRMHDLLRFAGIEVDVGEVVPGGFNGLQNFTWMRDIRLGGDR